MKRLFSILLVTVLLIPFAGAYLFFHFKELQIKKEVSIFTQNKIEEKDIITLRFSNEEIRTRLVWKHSREFVFEGNMYDIVDQGVDGNTTWYRCYRDHKETRLYKEKEKLIARALGNDPVQKKQSERIKQIFKTSFQDQSFSWNINLPHPSIIHYSLFTIHYSLILPSPPPRHLSASADIFFTTLAQLIPIFRNRTHRIHNRIYVIPNVHCLSMCLIYFI